MILQIGIEFNENALKSTVFKTTRAMSSIVTYGNACCGIDLQSCGIDHGNATLSYR
jgi:hypothetical protein